MPRVRWLSPFLLAWPAVAAEPPPPPPDAELLEFLGETAGEDEEFVRFMESGEAERALIHAEAKSSKDGDDEK
jgi:hypothetical protein